MKMIGMRGKLKRKRSIGRKMERLESKCQTKTKIEMKSEKPNNVKKRCKRLTPMGREILLRNHQLL